MGKESSIQETQLQSPDGEDPLEEGMATHFSILPWRIPWTEEPGRLQSIGRKESNKTGTTENKHMHNKQTLNNSETNLEAIAAV